MRPPRGVHALLAVLVLLLLTGLTVLAVLQYRWIERVAEAEHQRMRANINFAAQRFASDLRAELGDLFERFARREGGDLPQRYEEWSRVAPHPSLVANIYVIDRFEDAWHLRRLDTVALQLVEAPWPPALADLRRQLEDEGGGRRIHWPPPFDSEVPGMFIAPRRGLPPGFEMRDPPPPAIFLQLDRHQLLNAILPQLAMRHFATGTDSYNVAVQRGREILYRSAASWPDGRTPADVEMQFQPMVPGGGPRGRPEGGFGPPPPFDEPEPWRLLVRRRGGGLDALVAAARRRNLALSFGTLFILAATVVLLLALLRRADRLRAQQTQFVAAISHELNTPIAALRAAGENLKDGIVAEREKLARYGETIVRESARLGEMVAQVLDFAGIQARTSRAAQQEPVDIPAIVDDAVAQCRWLTDGNGIEVETRVDAGLPLVRGDAQSLTRAVQNLVANAIRHGGEGKWIGLRAARNGDDGVAITVEDRGPGIDNRDAARLFEPFYRGRHSSRVRGAGLGLAIVQQIARAHGGSVEIDRRRRTGAAFTLHLPAEADRG